MHLRIYRRQISNVLLIIGSVFVAVSIYCLWNAYQIGQQQLKQAGDDPFAMVFTDKTQPEGAATANAEMTRLNNRRWRNENTGWVLIISGVGLLVVASAIKGWRKPPVILGLGETR